MSSGSLPQDNDPCDHGGHQGDTGEGQGDRHGIVLLHFHATDGVGLELKGQKINYGGG